MGSQQSAYKGPPLFILKYGPPGSGKSNIINDIIKNKNLILSKFVDLNIDNEVYKIPEYQEVAEKCKLKYHNLAIKLSTFMNDNNLTSDQKLAYKEDYDNEMDNVNKECTNNYVTHRKSADILLDHKLDIAQKSRDHIIFETTGDNIKWYKEKLFPKLKILGYRIILVYPLINKETAIERINKRTLLEGRPVTDENLNRIFINSPNNLSEIVPFVDELLFYDNEINDQPNNQTTNIQKDSQKLILYTSCDYIRKGSDANPNNKKLILPQNIRNIFTNICGGYENKIKYILIIMLVIICIIILFNYLIKNDYLNISNTHFSYN